MTTEERYEMMYHRQPDMEIDGNTVRVAEPVREPERKKKTQERREQRRQPAPAVYSEWKDIRLYAAIVAIMLLCVCQVYLSSTKLSLEKKIASLETEVNTVQVDNNNLELEISEATDLKNIRKIATKRYGMSKPDASHIITYGSENQDYVRQYNNVSE